MNKIINGNFQGYENSPWEFRDWNDTLRQVWGPKDASWEFMDSNDTSGQVLRSKNVFREFRDLDDTLRQVWGSVMYFTLYFEIHLRVYPRGSCYTSSNSHQDVTLPLSPPFTTTIRDS